MIKSIKELVSYILKEGFLGKFLLFMFSVVMIFLLFLFYTMGNIIYQAQEHSRNGLKQGLVCSEIQKIEAHEELVPVYSSTLVGTQTISTTTYIPHPIPTLWFFNITNGERIETYCSNYYPLISRGSSINTKDFLFVKTIIK